jgi:ATP-binding cassette subfamily B protein/subfamily B ATP-binding cassette protein MsbA
MSFFTAMALAFQPLRRLAALAGIMQVAAASLERLYRLFDTAPTILSPDTGTAPNTGDILFRDVRLSYAGQPALDGVTFTARAGETTALVGPSGAGKSTIFNVLTRLIEPQDGQVELAGIPIGSIPLSALRAQFSVVTQDALLFDETLRDNLLLGQDDIDAPALADALEAAYLTDMVAELPEGLNTRAGPRGSSLSGGQRQRIAIARALLRKAPILLLDEATSALDAQSEAAVQVALDALSDGRTTLVIAHRLSTVRNADRIVVLDKGRVVEEGTHESLIAQGGTYADLYRLQFADEASG